MAVKYFSRPKLNNPVLIAAWPGIGNIGFMAIEHMRQQVDARELAEIEPWDFFYPKAVKVKNGLMEDMVFPMNRFYYHRSSNQDLIFFIGEEQPNEGIRRYAGGRKAYDLAHLVIDAAEKFGCRRVYTSGAAVSLTHHTMDPRVWAVVNNSELRREFENSEEIHLLTDSGRRNDNAVISGLNGLLLGVARQRGLEGVCIMGEIPVYLQGLAMPYPKSAKAVIEAFSQVTGTSFSSSALDFLIQSMDVRIDELMKQFSSSLPPPIRKDISDGIEQLKQSQGNVPSPGGKGSFTKENVKRAIDEIEFFFKQGGNSDEGSV